MARKEADRKQNKRRKVAKRVTREQVLEIAGDFMAKVPLTMICETHQISRGTVVKLHKHISRVGHYGELAFKLPIPPLQIMPARRRSRRNVVTDAIMAALESVEEATPAMVYEILQQNAVMVPRASLQNTLLRLAKERRINRRPGWYSLRKTSGQDE